MWSPPPLGGEGDLGVDSGHHGDHNRSYDATQIGIPGVTVDRPGHQRHDGQWDQGCQHPVRYLCVVTEQAVDSSDEEIPISRCYYKQRSSLNSDKFIVDARQSLRILPCL